MRYYRLLLLIKVMSGLLRKSPKNKQNEQKTKQQLLNTYVITFVIIIYATTTNEIEQKSIKQ